MMADLDPVDFGAVGDGATDDTAAFARTAEAASDGGRIVLHGRRYLLREIVLRPGMAGIQGPGTLIGTTRDETGIIHCEREWGQDHTPIRFVTLRDLTFEQGPARCAIDLIGVEDSCIENCTTTISGDPQKGIWLRDACVRVTIRGCRILAPVGESLRSIVGVEVDSYSAAKSPGGYFDGTSGTADYDDRSWGNVLDGNTIVGGTHGVAVGSAARTQIVNNTIVDSLWRNINLCPASRYTIVSHNQLLGAGSSAVAMAYGTCYTVVTNNEIASWRTVPGVDRDAIHAYVASGHNRIAGNVVIGNFRYGVYLAAGGVANQVHDNRFRLEPNPRVPQDWNAAIGLETDWMERPLPATAHFSRQNFGAPPPGEHWAYVDTTDNVVHDNLIEQATCGIYLAQFGERGLFDNRLTGNRCLDGVDVALCVHASAPDRIGGLQVSFDVRGGVAPRMELPAWLTPADLA